MSIFEWFSSYDVSYIKIKIRIYGAKVYTNYQVLNVPEDDKNVIFYSHFY